jgi:hypothetical protein
LIHSPIMSGMRPCGACRSYVDERVGCQHWPRANPVESNPSLRDWIAFRNRVLSDLRGTKGSPAFELMGRAARSASGELCIARNGENVRYTARRLLDKGFIRRLGTVRSARYELTPAGRKMFDEISAARHG